MAERAAGRRVQLMDTAVELVADGGMHALTHRRLDAAAGAPAGTSSAYFRTREALVSGLVHRIVELDRELLAALALDPEAQAPDLDTAAEGSAAFIDWWLTAGRSRALARYQCLMESGRYPWIRDLLAPQEQAAREQAYRVLSRAGAPDARARAAAYTACVDGIVLDRLLGEGAASAPAPGTAENRAELAAVIRRLLGAFAAP